MKRLKHGNGAIDAQSISILESVANDELSNKGSCVIFTETRRFISKDGLLQQAFNTIKEDLNLLRVLKSLDSNNAKDIQKFEQMIEILGKEAQLSRTLEYLSEDGDSPFWSMLQSKRQNIYTDCGTLELLKCLKRDKNATGAKSISILESVAKDELSNGSCAIYKETKEFIDGDSFLKECYYIIKQEQAASSSTELSKEQAVASSSLNELTSAQCGRKFSLAQG